MRPVARWHSRNSSNRHRDNLQRGGWHRKPNGAGGFGGSDAPQESVYRKRSPSSRRGRGLAAIPATERENLGKPLEKPADLIHAAAMGTGGLAGFHFHHHALDIRIGNDRAALVAAELAPVGDDLDKTAVTVGIKKFVCGYGKAMGDSQNVQAQHPPDQEERDDGHDNIANPLSQRFRLSSVFHG
jgi:hypothetical protein